jgi:nucleotide-binding universal stress UspA family protein
MSGPIVAGVDGSEPATAAVRYAAADAARRGRPLRLVHVAEPWAHDQLVRDAHRRPEIAEHANLPEEYCQGVLDAAARVAREVAPRVEVSTALRTGRVIEAFLAESATAEQIVLGSRGLGGFAGLVLGSVTLGVAGHAAAPTVVVREEPETEYGEIVVGYDAAGASQAALEYAFEEAARRGCALRAVYAWQPPAFSPLILGYSPVFQETFESRREAARRLLDPWRDKFPQVTLVETTVCGHPVPALRDAAERADLVVVGSRGLDILGSAVLGSVSHGVLHHVRRPVAVVRPRQVVD